MKTKEYYTYVIKGLWSLILRAYPFWAFPIVILLFLFLPHWTIRIEPETNIRLSGLLLQVLFVVIVLFDIYELRKDFGLPGLREIIKQWFKDLKKVFKKEGRMSVNAGSYSSAHGYAHGGFILDDSLSVEKRLSLIEKEINLLRTQTVDEIRKISKYINSLEGKLDQEIEDRKDELSSLSKFFERISTKGLKKEVVGLMWLIVGLVLSIFPTELSYILNWL